MRMLLATLVLTSTAVMAVSAQPMAPSRMAPQGMEGPRCINTRNIESSKSDDGRILVFKMRDGTTLVNHLQGVCTNLRFNGYVWQLRSGDTEVCAGQQSLQVLQSGQVCVLGKFDPPRMSRGTN